MIDETFLVALQKLAMDDEGSLFNNPNRAGKQAQIDFLLRVLSVLDPKYIVEIGTNVGGFDYLALDLLPEVNIFTFDIKDYSAAAVEMLNTRFINRTRFIRGDSKETFSRFNPEEKIDLAYIDGNHFENCYGDLENCARLKIRDILVDDFRLLECVENAVYDVIEKYGFCFRDCSPTIDDRGIVWLRKE